MRHSDARLGAVGRRCRVDVDVDVVRLVRVAQRHDAGGSHGGALLVVDVGIGVDRHLRRRFGLFLFSTQTPEMNTNRVNRVIQNPTKMSDSDSSEQLATLNVDVEKKTSDDEEDRCVRGLECVSIFV